MHNIEEYHENYWYGEHCQLSNIDTQGPKLFIYYTMKYCENWKMLTLAR